MRYHYLLSGSVERTAPGRPQRFDFHQVLYETQERTPMLSGKFYREIIKSSGIV
ncbi:MAG: hypothetical protein KJN98_07385 [Pontiella sp.]|nr:hypothetical protein [Pontiella sp.]